MPNGQTTTQLSPAQQATLQRWQRGEFTAREVAELQRLQRGEFTPEERAEERKSLAQRLLNIVIDGRPGRTGEIQDTARMTGSILNMLQMAEAAAEAGDLMTARNLSARAAAYWPNLVHIARLYGSEPTPSAQAAVVERLRRLENRTNVASNTWVGRLLGETAGEAAEDIPTQLKKAAIAGLVAGAVMSGMFYASAAAGALATAMGLGAGPIPIVIPTVGVATVSVDMPALLSALAGMGVFVAGLELGAQLGEGAGALVPFTMPAVVIGWDMVRGILMGLSPDEIAGAIVNSFLAPSETGMALPQGIDESVFMRQAGLPDTPAGRFFTTFVGMAVTHRAVGRLGEFLARPEVRAAFLNMPIEAQRLLLAGFARLETVAETTRGLGLPAPFGMQIIEFPTPEGAFLARMEARRIAAQRAGVQPPPLTPTVAPPAPPEYARLAQALTAGHRGVTAELLGRIQLGLEQLGSLITPASLQTAVSQIARDLRFGRLRVPGQPEVPSVEQIPFELDRRITLATEARRVAEVVQPPAPTLIPGAQIAPSEAIPGPTLTELLATPEQRGRSFWEGATAETRRYWLGETPTNIAIMTWDSLTQAQRAIVLEALGISVAPPAQAAPVVPPPPPPRGVAVAAAVAPGGEEVPRYLDKATPQQIARMLDLQADLEARARGPKSPYRFDPDALLGYMWEGAVKNNWSPADFIKRLQDEIYALPPIEPPPSGAAPVTVTLKRPAPSTGIRLPPSPSMTQPVAPIPKVTLVLPKVQGLRIGQQPTVTTPAESLESKIQRAEGMLRKTEAGRAWLASHRKPTGIGLLGLYYDATLKALGLKELPQPVAPTAPVYVEQPVVEAPKAPLGKTPDEAILGVITMRPMSIQDIINATGLPAQAVLSKMFPMEMAGLVKNVGDPWTGPRYVQGPKYEKPKPPPKPPEAPKTPPPQVPAAPVEAVAPEAERVQLQDLRVGDTVSIKGIGYKVVLVISRFATLAPINPHIDEEASSRTREGEVVYVEPNVSVQPGEWLQIDKGSWYRKPIAVTPESKPSGAMPELPPSLKGAKPRYGYGQRNFELNFLSDVDRALYIVAQKAPLSAHDAAYMDFLRRQGFTGTDAEIRAKGQEVRDFIKVVARDAAEGVTTLHVIPLFQPTTTPEAPELPFEQPPSVLPEPERIDVSSRAQDITAGTMTGDLTGKWAADVDRIAPASTQIWRQASEAQRTAWLANLRHAWTNVLQLHLGELTRFTQEAFDILLRRAVDRANAETPMPPTVTRFDISQVPIMEVSLSEVDVSPELPNFKKGADPITGIVKGEELAGGFERLGTAPVVLWKDLSGRLLVATGRYRVDLARRTGEKTIPAQIVEESKGFTRQMALTFDAESNIRDGQGRTQDYAHYFRNSPQLAEGDARARGLLARTKGQAGWDLGKHASDDIFALYQGGKISEAQALAIVRAAPDNAAAQQIGAKYAMQGQKPDFVSNIIKASLQAAVDTGKQLDMFGHDTALMREMVERAKTASKMQRDIAEQIRAVEGAAKRPGLAKTGGVEVAYPLEVLNRVAQLKAELERWQNWPLWPELVEKVVGKAQPQAAPAEAPSAPATPISTLESVRRGEGVQRGVDITAIRAKLSANPNAEVYPLEDGVRVAIVEPAQEGYHAVFIRDRNTGQLLERHIEKEVVKAPGVVGGTVLPAAAPQEAAAESAQVVVVSSSGGGSALQVTLPGRNSIIVDTFLAVRDGGAGRRLSDAEAIRVAEEVWKERDWENATAERLKAKYPDASVVILGDGSVQAARVNNKGKVIKVLETVRPKEAAAPVTRVVGERFPLQPMVDEARRWQGAALNADALYGTDTRARLHHSQTTTKGDLDAYLQRKFGIDEVMARMVSNELTAKNLAADRSAKVEDFVGEPWADAALRYGVVEKVEAAAPEAKPKEPWEMSAQMLPEIAKRESGGLEHGLLIDDRTGDILASVPSIKKKLKRIGVTYNVGFAIDFDPVVSAVVKGREAELFGHIAEYHYHPVKGGPSTEDVQQWLSSGPHWSRIKGVVDDREIYTLRFPEQKTYEENIQAAYRKGFSAPATAFASRQLKAIQEGKGYRDATDEALRSIAHDYGIEYSRTDLAAKHGKAVTLEAKPKEAWEMTEFEWMEYRSRIVPEFVGAGQEYKRRYSGRHETINGKWIDALDANENPDSALMEFGRTYRDTVNKSDAWLEKHPEFSVSHDEAVRQAAEHGKIGTGIQDYPDIAAKYGQKAKEPQVMMGEETYQRAATALKKAIAGSTSQEIEEQRVGVGINAAVFARRFADPIKQPELYRRIYDLYFETLKEPTIAPPQVKEQTFEEFDKEYRYNFDQMMKYTPDQVGSKVFSDRMAEMSDRHPDWVERIEAEAEAEAKAKKGAPQPPTVKEQLGMFGWKEKAKPVEQPQLFEAEQTPELKHQFEQFRHSKGVKDNQYDNMSAEGKKSLLTEWEQYRREQALWLQQFREKKVATAGEFGTQPLPQRVGGKRKVSQAEYQKAKEAVDYWQKQYDARLEMWQKGEWTGSARRNVLENTEREVERAKQRLEGMEVEKPQATGYRSPAFTSIKLPVFAALPGTRPRLV